MKEVDRFKGKEFVIVADDFSDPNGSTVTNVPVKRTNKVKAPGKYKK